MQVWAEEEPDLILFQLLTSPLILILVECFILQSFRIYFFPYVSDELLKWTEVIGKNSNYCRKFPPHELHISMFLSHIFYLGVMLWIKICKSSINLLQPVLPPCSRGDQKVKGEMKRASNNLKWWVKSVCTSVSKGVQAAPGDVHRRGGWHHYRQKLQNCYF